MPASQAASPGTRTGWPAASQTVTTSREPVAPPAMAQSVRAGGIAPPAVNCA